VLAARRAEALAAAVAECRAAGAPSAEGRVCDVARAGDVEALVRWTVERHSRLDVLVNNAGFGIFGAFEDSPVEDLDRIVATNLLGTMYGMRAAIPVMRRQGSGHILNISSVAGRMGIGGMAAYCATKFAQVGLSQAVRAELRGTGVHVTVVLPVSTRTDFFRTALKTPGTPEVGMAWPVHSAEKVARRLLRCARRPSPEVILFWPARVGVALLAMFPKLADLLPMRVPGTGLRKT
ncbi:MAG: SDR family oxidoreductase, partial [Planctomycetales bacterium]|nr:SDR family oxidoreductase [Planctomycetales bacterium]